MNETNTVERPVRPKFWMDCPDCDAAEIIAAHERRKSNLPERDDDGVMTCGACEHLCGEECGHHGREVNTGDAACDYFATANAEITGLSG